MDDQTHPVCRGRYTIDGACASLVYNGIVKKLVYQFKYNPYLTDLAPTLGELLYEGIIQKPMFQKAIETKPVFVPVPLYSKKLRKRGYNQAELLAKFLAKQVQLPVASLLERTKKTHTQVGLNKTERKANIAGAFQVNKKVKQPPSAVLLIDDVLTTGSTLSEAASVLKRAGVKKVWGITLAQGQ